MRITESLPDGYRGQEPISGRGRMDSGICSGSPATCKVDSFFLKDALLLLVYNQKENILNPNIKLTDECMLSDAPLVDWLTARFADCDHPVVVCYVDRNDAAVQRNNLVVQQQFLDNTGRLVRCDSVSPCARTGTPYTVFARVEITPEMAAQLPYFENFFQAYQAAAVWAETDDYGQPLDSNYSISDFSAESKKRMRLSCAVFIAQNLSLLQSAVWHSGYNWEQAGHDFWLTRNGHGAGFWDRGLKDIGDRLSDSARKFSGSRVEAGCCLAVFDDKPVEQPVSFAF